jgi:hypothetical protein
LKLQRPLRDGMLDIVARGEKEDPPVETVRFERWGGAIIDAVACIWALAAKDANRAILAQGAGEIAPSDKTKAASQRPRQGPLRCKPAGAERALASLIASVSTQRHA